MDMLCFLLSNAGPKVALLSLHVTEDNVTALVCKKLACGIIMAMKGPGRQRTLMTSAWCGMHLRIPGIPHWPLVLKGEWRRGTREGCQMVLNKSMLAVTCWCSGAR